MTMVAKIPTVFAAFLLGIVPAVAQQQFATQFGLGSVGLGSDNNTKWVSICPAGTTVVSGSCLAPEGGVPLRSFGMNPNNSSWECVWTHSVPKANVRAFCSSTQ
jgi:hypothetical protein